MRLSTIQATKIDSALRKVLEKAQGDEFLRTVMVLGSKPINQSRTIDSSTFPSRTAYRQALIKTQQEQTSEELDGIKQELYSRSLDVKGGSISRAVVVEGTARDILSSLEIPGVQHASLDQPLDIKL